MRTYTKTLILCSLFVSLVLTGCGGPPQNNPLLTEAETAYHQAETDSMIVKKAPVALKEAEEALEQSQQIWQNKGEKKLIEHYAYIAHQKTKIAKETAMLNDVQNEVERAEAERKQVLIEARKAEALAAESRAEEALEQVQQERAEAERARQEAERARQEASELADRLSELEARQSERGMVLTLSDVLFDFDSAELKPGASKVVNELSNFLREYPERKVQIEGFTDSIGSAEYNQQLSQRRADALRRALINAGISSSRIETVGYGEDFPVATNINEAGRQQNRRVEVIISKDEENVAERRE